MATASRRSCFALFSALSIIATACTSGGDETGSQSSTDLAARTCSSISLVNHGSSVFGKNLDNTYSTGGLVLVNKRGVQRTGRGVSTTGRRAQWISKYASINFCFVHLGLVWTGMNEKGLAISMMGIPEAQGPPPDSRPPLEDGLWIQFMLDTCTTVDEVLAAAEGVRIVTIDHYHVADRNGDSAVIEFLGGDKHVYVGSDLPISALTNSTYGDSIRDWDFFNRYGFPTNNGSLERFRIAAQRILDFESTDDDSAVTYAFDTLFDIRSEAINPFPSTTQWSFVFDTENLRAYFRTHDHPRIKYFDIYDFDLTCNTPVQMLDIQTAGSGDVSDLFEDVTYDAACAHLRHFIESFLRRTPSQNEVESTIEYFMSFPCVGTGAAPRTPSGRRIP